MVNAKKEGLIEATDAKLVEKIFKRYLVDEYQEDERKVKLKPIKKDMQAFDALLYKPKDQYIKESNVTRNYDFFYNKITSVGLTLDELFETIKKLEVINIRLDEDDDPQLIFESLNSTGLDSQLSLDVTRTCRTGRSLYSVLESNRRIYQVRSILFCT